MRVTHWWEKFWNRTESGSKQELRVFFRSLAPPVGMHQRRKRLLNALAAAEEDNVFDSFEVTVLGREICRCDECQRVYRDTDLMKTIEHLLGWRTGGIRVNGFDTRRVDSSITGEHYEAVIPPETSIAVYAEGTLSGVFPCSVEGESYGIDRFLTDLVATAPRRRSLDRYRDVLETA